MGIDLPPVTSAEIGSEFQKPLSQEVISVGECKSPDFQTQFDELQTQTKEKTAKLQEEMQYSEKQKELLRNIYYSLGEDNPELKSAIETQSIKIFEVPNRELIALYNEGGNLLYFSTVTGEKYFNLEKIRNGLLKGGLEIGYNRLSGVEQKIKDGKFLLFRGENEITINSEEYILIVLKSADLMLQFQKDVSEEIKRREREEYVNAFKKFPDYKGSKIEKAIEEGTLEIKKIQGREAIAVYESIEGNLIYLTNLKGEPYINVDHFRTVQMLSDIFEAGYLRQGYSRIENVDGLWKLYNKDGKEIPISSDEYSTATLTAINLMLDFSDYIYDEAQSKGLIK